eukprot:3718348-Alexandrium_andersonii.AAC.1
MPGHIFVLQSNKGWNTAEVLAKHAKLIAQAAARSLPNSTCLPTMDVAKLHLNWKVVRACRSHGIQYHLVPAKTTWLLQP